jgi:hypothetical protein
MSAATTVEAATAAAVESASTTEPTTVEATTANATAMETTTTNGAAVEATARRGSSKGVSAAYRTSRSVERVSSASIADATVVRYATPVSISRATPVSGMTPVSAAAIVSATPVSVVPRASADEYATDKPARTVVAVRCACIWIVGVVAPRAYRRDCRVTVPISRVTVANPDPYVDLGLSRSRNERGRNHEDAEQQKIP